MNHNDKKFIAEKIRTQYVKPQVGELDELRALDAKVKRPANIFAYIFGSVSAIIMGSGMSLIMTDIAQYIGLTQHVMPIGIAVGCVGLVLALVNYPIYKRILNSRKKKYASQIITLSERIVSEEQ